MYPVPQLKGQQVLELHQEGKERIGKLPMHSTRRTLLRRLLQVTHYAAIGLKDTTGDTLCDPHTDCPESMTFRSRDLRGY